MTTIVLPEGFHYVGASITSTFFLLGWQTFLVSRARKRVGIKYPQLYAEQAEVEKNKEAMIYNCTQRAHQNTLEVVNSVVAGTVLLGLKYPIPAAVACGLWSLSRIFYTLGYSSGDPDKRIGGMFPLGQASMVAIFLGSGFIWGKAALTGAM